MPLKAEKTSQGKTSRCGSNSFAPPTHSSDMRKTPHQGEFSRFRLRRHPRPGGRAWRTLSIMLGSCADNHTHRSPSANARFQGAPQSLRLCPTAPHPAEKRREHFEDFAIMSTSSRKRIGQEARKLPQFPTRTIDVRQTNVRQALHTQEITRRDKPSPL